MSSAAAAMLARGATATISSSSILSRAEEGSTRVTPRGGSARAGVAWGGGFGGMGDATMRATGGWRRGRWRVDVKLRRSALEMWDAETAECMLMEGGTSVVSFGTTWCGPCALLAPELAAAAGALEDHGEIVVAKVDAEAAPRLASAYGVGAYPTTIWLREGREVHRLEGSLPAAALVQLTAGHLMTREEEEVLRIEQPEWFGPMLLEPAEFNSQQAPDIF